MRRAVQRLAEPRPLGGTSRRRKLEIFLEVGSQEISQTDATRKYWLDVIVLIWLRALTKDAALAAFASAKPSRRASAEAIDWSCCERRTSGYPRRPNSSGSGSPPTGEGSAGFSARSAR
jgi:hypothetical protein